MNDAEKIEPLMTQMEQWSILSNVLNYIQHNRHRMINQNFSIRAVNRYQDNSKTKEERETTELDFGIMPQILCEKYVDVYEGIQSKIVNTTRFDENSDLRTTYLGKSDKTRNVKVRVEESFPILEHGYSSGRLLNGTECQLLMDTGMSKSFMSKSFYMQCKSLHSLPKFASKTQRIQVGNGQCVSVLFIIPVKIDVHGHRFKI